MPKCYHPPFTISEEITNLVIEIAEYMGAITAREKQTGQAAGPALPSSFTLLF